MQRLLAFCQLTRAALVFTAVADSWALLLYHIPGQPPQTDIGTKLLLTALASGFLYLFGMALNDLLDARRDQIFARWRPIPSGRITPWAAVVVCMILLMLSLLAATLLGIVPKGSQIPWPAFVALATALFIVFYDAAAKYLGAVGLITLGMVRGLNCLIGKPTFGFLLLPLVLFTHIALISAVSYYLELKRPRLRTGDVVLLLVGIGSIDGLLIAAMLWKHTLEWPQVPVVLAVAAAALMFAILCGWIISRQCLPPRVRGARIMLLGLFWLFVYDFAVLAANKQWSDAGLIVGDAAASLGAFYLLRFWAKGTLPGKPHYRIARKPGC